MKKLLMALAACVALTAQADTGPSPDTEPENDSDLPPWADEQIEPLHDSVSRWVETTSRRIDGFFGTTDALSIENDSYLRISQGWRWKEGQAFKQDIGARFRLDLPTTEERLQPRHRGHLPADPLSARPAPRHPLPGRGPGPALPPGGRPRAPLGPGPALGDVLPPRDRPRAPLTSAPTCSGTGAPPTPSD